MAHASELGVPALDPLEALAAVADRLVIALDFDGTLAPIVDDPEHAYIHADAHRVLVDLAPHVGALAIVTGRPVEQVLRLGRLTELGEAVEGCGRNLYVHGQYGNETWTSQSSDVASSQPPDGLADFTAELPAILDQADVSDAFIEDKGIAVAVHTRRLPSADAAFERALASLKQVASTYDLAVEPGKHVVEIRARGMHKGLAIESLVARTEALGILFAGDDLGDLEAFKELDALRGLGAATLSVCADAGAEARLRRAADLTVDGPDGVLDLLRRLTEVVAGA